MLGKPKLRKPGDLPAHRLNGRTGCSAAGWMRNPLVRSRGLLSCPNVWKQQDKIMSVTLHVCITCKAGETVPEGTACPGTRLHAALMAAGAPETVQIVPVECLSACSQGCSVALSSPGRWSYVYGRMTESDAAEILSGAAAYANTPDGIVPWRERPTIFRKQSLARIPPMVLA